MEERLRQSTPLTDAEQFHIAATIEAVLEQNPASQVAQSIREKLEHLLQPTAADASLEAESSTAFRYVIDEESLAAGWPGQTVEGFQEVLEQEVGIHQMYADCCAMANIQGKIHRPINVHAARASGVTRDVMRLFGSQKKETAGGDLYAFEKNKVRMYDIIRLQFAVAKDMQWFRSSTTNHELWHVLLNRHPPECAEWLAELGKYLYAKKFGCDTWDDACADKIHLISGKPTGFLTHPQIKTMQYRNIHKTVGWAGANMLLTGLGNNDEERLQNFPKLAAVSHMEPDKNDLDRWQELPDLHQWLRELDDAIPGFFSRIKDHPALQRFGDADTIVACDMHSKKGCTVMRYRVQFNPSFGTAQVPRGQPLLRENFDMKQDNGYEELPIRVIVHTDNMPPFWFEKPGKMVVTPDGIRTFLASEGCRTDFQTYTVEVPRIEEGSVILGPYRA